MDNLTSPGPLAHGASHTLVALALAAFIPCACALKQPKVPIVWTGTGNGHLGTPVARFPSKQLQQLNLNARHPASVYVVETNSLFHFTAPDTLFKESLTLEVGVTHYKAPSGAWGQYVLYFILHDARDSQPRVALGMQQHPVLPN